MAIIHQILAGSFPAAGGGASSTWNPADKAASVTLSGGDLIATYSDGLGSSYHNVRSTDGKSTGKLYSEHTLFASNTSQRSIGIATSSASLTDYGGKTTASIAYYMDGTVYYNDGLVTTIQTTTSGQRVDMAVDLGGGLIWWRTNGGNWNNDGSADPATGTGGITLGVTGTRFVMTSLRNISTPDSDTAVFSSASWAGTAPSGFGQWGA